MRTFLIADIRGYTRFTNQFGDEAASVLAGSFAQIVAEAMEAWDGNLVELRGDEALCTFESPRASLRCAIELQETFTEEAAAAPNLPLLVGIGLDAGEAVPVGDGYRGAALNVAARLCAGATAGEIRVTQNLAHLAGPIPGLVYETQGSESLKGIAEDVPIVRVRAVAAESIGPPAAGGTDGRDKEPLPAALEPTVPLVGRRNDLLWLQWQWRRARLGHGRTVEVVGRPGMGKTRLVAEVARLAHAEGATVRLATSVAELTDLDPTRHALAVIDDIDLTPAGSLDGFDDLQSRVANGRQLVVLTRRPGTGDLRIGQRLLAPLTEADVAEIVALYAGRGVEPPPARRVLEQSEGIPAEVHRIAGQWARAAAMDRMSKSARRTSRERRGLRAAEEELIDRYADLELVREQARLYAPNDDPAGRPVPGPAHGVCPYKGLSAYDANDAEYFFGREQLVGELVARVVGSPFVALVGASGSGKSSALHAGLLPALSSGVLPGSQNWIQVLVRPGTRPMHQVAAALGRTPLPEPGDGSGPDALLDQLTGRMSPAQRLLMVVDQFEEVFTADEGERDAFIDFLTASRPAVKVVLAIRADQYGLCASYPRLARLMAADQVLVGPIGRDEVAAIARHPAERVGLRVEPQLVDALISDLGTEPGAMPLLSTALLELWEARDQGWLTHAAYRTTGGVQGAVARLAESAFARLDPQEQDAARSLFLRLVGEGSEPDTLVRRRLPMAELAAIGDPRISVVVDHLTTGRLLTRDEATVEVAHEALIREWPRLRDWIEQDAQGRQVRLHIIGAANAWDAGGRGEEDLYRGARLATAREWAAEHESELNAVERDFLDASRATAERAAERQRRTNRILRGLLAGAGVLLIVAIGAGVIAWVQAGQNADNAFTASVRELSLSALTLAPEDPELGLLLATEAVRLSHEAGRPPPALALQALWSAYVAGKGTTTVSGVGAQAVAYSPDGSQLAVDAPEREDALITFRDPSSGEERGVIPASQGAGRVVESIVYSPDGRLVAAGLSGAPGAGDGSVEVFDAASGASVQRLSLGHDGYHDLSIADSGLLVASVPGEGRRNVEVVAWDVETGRERAVLAVAPGFDGTDISNQRPVSAAVRPRTGQLILGTRTGSDATTFSLMAVDLGSDVLRCPSCPDKGPVWAKLIQLTPDVLAPSPVDDRIAVADVGQGRVAVIDPLLGVPVFEPVSYQNPGALTWNADGTLLAVSGGESGVIVIDAVEGLVRATLPSRGQPILSASFRSGSDEIAAVTVRGELLVRRTTPTAGDVSTGGRRLVAFGLTEEHVILSLAEFGVTVHERLSGTELHARDFAIDSQLHAPVAPDAGAVAATYQNGSGVLVEAATLREIARLPGCLRPAAVSADARYVVLDGGSDTGGDSCVDADTTGGIYDTEASTMVVEYGREVIRHGSFTGPLTGGNPGYAVVAVHEDGAAAGRIDIWDLQGANLLASINEEDQPGFLPAFVSFTPDGRHLAIATTGPRALVVDVAALLDGSTVEEAIVFDREVHTSRAAKAVLTDSGILATASGDGVYRLWDIASGEMTMQLETDGRVDSGLFEFSPDFSHFYYEDTGGVVRPMPMDVDELILMTSTGVHRSLTDGECRQYLHLDACEQRPVSQGASATR